MESKLKYYRISGYCGHRRFEETTSSPTQARAESNVRWRVHQNNRYTSIGDIVITSVEILNSNTRKFERVT